MSKIKEAKIMHAEARTSVDIEKAAEAFEHYEFEALREGLKDDLQKA